MDSTKETTKIGEKETHLAVKVSVGDSSLAFFPLPLFGTPGKRSSSSRSLSKSPVQAALDGLPQAWTVEGLKRGDH